MGRWGSGWAGGRQERKEQRGICHRGVCLLHVLTDKTQQLSHVNPCLQQKGMDISFSISLFERKIEQNEEKKKSWDFFYVDI